VTGTAVSTHVLDTATGRPASGIGVELAAAGPDGGWLPVGAAMTDDDGRCRQLPPLPPDVTRARLRFTLGPDADRAFFPEITVVFRIVPGQRYHVPLLLSPFGYVVYRGS
jgi:5-hydroxyisourate hydrolase